MAKQPHETEQAGATEHANQPPKKTTGHDDSAEQRAELDKAREAKYQADEKQHKADHDAEQKQREAAYKYADARKKEDERLAALSPEERAAEEKKRAKMTAEERQKDDESKGLSPAFDPPEISLLVATPQFTVQTETPHAAEFVLSEANGAGSRDAVTIAIGDSVKIGQTLKVTTPATTSALAVATGNVTTDTAADAIALYNAPVSTVAQNIAVISRNAEVNGNLLYFPGTITATDKNNIAKALAVHNIMARF